MRHPEFSIIIPVYNRPDELNELLKSFTQQTFSDFEVIVVEDGSIARSDNVVEQYRPQLDIQYFYKSNEGPGPARNFGFHRARGNYFVVFDSDCILPPHYFESVVKVLSAKPVDAWGGPDRGHESFTKAQRAMAYTMASVLTTGGIRGGKKRVGWFQPRSFNMGISRKVFEATGGFRFDRFAEDIELSIRMKKAGFHVVLIPEAFVYHKRRTTFGQFFKQVFNFGKGRAMIGRVYPDEVKLTHWFPSLFTLGTLCLPVLPWLSPVLFKLALSLYGLYLIAVFVHATISAKSLVVGLLSVPSALLQLWGYGLGFLKWKFFGKNSFLKGRSRNI